MELFEYELEMFLIDYVIEVMSLLGCMVIWCFDESGILFCWFYGYVSEFEWMGCDDKFFEYCVVVKFWLWMLI